ncbi:hypothetical protein RRG08_024732 [Elysia crispata]|uniref:Uncharacterized protein n=1 Tax=Elysia crispata TaxID=231223 RepID=A0AAE0YDI3_9GAST|nr:hypothetical protein RRG08_024732 [Elysia crispata]
MVGNRKLPTKTSPTDGYVDLRSVTVIGSPCVLKPDHGDCLHYLPPIGQSAYNEKHQGFVVASAHANTLTTDRLTQVRNRRSKDLIQQ